MKKTIFKLFALLFITLLFFSSVCFATDNLAQDGLETLNSNLYVENNSSSFDIKNIINGNAFVSSKVLNIDSSNKGGQISGDLFAMANEVNIKSDITYSQDNTISKINSYSSINGNVYVLADSFSMEPGCEITGDLYVCAKEVTLGENAKINGNAFVVSNSVTLDAKIYKSLYVTTKDFKMNYNGFINEDLNLDSENVYLNGYVYRDSFISADEITLDKNFINEKTFTVTNANQVTLDGKLNKDVNINSKKLQFADNSTCKVSGSLNYSSNEEIEFPQNTVQGQVNYTKYVSSNTKNFGSKLLDYIISLITSLVLLIVVYFVINKFLPNVVSKLSNLNISKFLLSLAIGLGILIVLPIVVILLFITKVGSTLGLLLTIIYVLLLILAKPLFIISISSIIAKKISLNKFLLTLIVAIALSLICLIPYLGFIVSMLELLCGLGLLLKNFN